jgi:ribonuclease HII
MARHRHRSSPSGGRLVVNERFAFDLERCGAAASGGYLVAGADEAGRGSLAGPLVAAAVCFDYTAWTNRDYRALDTLTDSKQLSEERREGLYAEVLRRARRVAVVAISPATIDERGLHVCNLRALGEALEALRIQPTTAFTDGFHVPSCALEHEAVVGGDGRSGAIAAASIVAKVTRDRVMHALHERYPSYGFDHNVGYATPFHQEMITEYGVCELHRLSFDAVCYRQLGLVFDDERLVVDADEAIVEAGPRE